MQNLPQKIRSKKLSTQVDLTAMVSVSFLLIIFFMVTIELSKPKAVDLSLPDREWELRGFTNCGAGISDRIVTVLLDGNNQIILYDGYLSFSLEGPKRMEYGKNGVRKELSKINSQIQESYVKIGRRKGAIVIIKPGKKSNLKNLIDILDEMAITKIDTYAIVNEFSPEETQLLASN